MADNKLYYRSFGRNWGPGCFQVSRIYRFKTAVRPKSQVNLPFFSLDTEGNGSLYPGFAFDGASGPIRQTEALIRGAAEHDAIYRAIREGVLPPEARLIADRELRDNVFFDGATMVEADIIYQAVSVFGAQALTGGNPERVTP